MCTRDLVDCVTWDRVRETVTFHIGTRHVDLKPGLTISRPVLCVAQDEVNGSVRFSLSTDRGHYPVTLTAPTEELIRPNPTSQEEAETVGPSQPHKKGPPTYTHPNKTRPLLLLTSLPSPPLHARRSRA